MIKLKKRKKKRLLTIAIYIFVMSLILSYFLIKYYATKMNPTLLTYATSEVKKLTTIIINNTVTSDTKNSIKTNNLYTIEKNQTDEISLINFNSSIVAKEMNNIVAKIQTNLNYLEEGKFDNIEISKGMLDKYDIVGGSNQGIIYQIPLGVVTSNPLLSNIGPKIPIKISFIGDVICNLEAIIKEYGINNALIELSIKVEVNTKIYLPFVSDDIIIITSIPLSTTIIPGKVPDYYMESGASSSNIFKIPLIN